MLRTNPTGNVPYTPILPLLYGMEASLKLLADEGMANVAARHHRCAGGAWSGACVAWLACSSCLAWAAGRGHLPSSRARR